MDNTKTSDNIVETPVQGKTFSLYGDTPDTRNYYSDVNKIIGLCLAKCPDRKKLISLLECASGKKQLKTNDPGSLVNFIVRITHEKLSKYTKMTCTHLKELPFHKRLTDKTLATSEEQYHLFMLEIALINMEFKESFKKAEEKLAFLPHCLRDLSANCRSQVEGLDNVCKSCSKICMINRVSRLLKKYNVKPYIWMNANIKSVFKKMEKEKRSLGVLGIACIPELISGMRLCMRRNIPVVGIPLNANRCARWIGAFHQTFVNMEELEKLL
ncbi:MAG: DUF116 domain-containing protein [bacterium]